jgi:hypothetical protein
MTAIAGTLKLLKQENEYLRAEVERLKTALVFYAAKSKYLQRGWQGDPMPSYVDEDEGQVARAALDPKP